MNFEEWCRTQTNEEIENITSYRLSKIVDERRKEKDTKWLSENRNKYFKYKSNDSEYWYIPYGDKCIRLYGNGIGYLKLVPFHLDKEHYEEITKEEFMIAMNKILMTIKEVCDFGSFLNEVKQELHDKIDKLFGDD